MLLLGFELNVGLLSNDQVLFGELLLVRIEFLLEHRHLPLGMLLSQITHLVLVLILDLCGLVVEVLLLGLYDDM